MNTYGEHFKVRINENLAKAIKSMRDACDDAERQIPHATSPGYAVLQTFHLLNRGNANAMQSIESASRDALEYVHIAEVHEAGKEKS